MSEQSKLKGTELHADISRILHLTHCMLFQVVNYWSQCHIQSPGGTFSLLLDPIKVRVHTPGGFPPKRGLPYVMDAL